MSDDLRSIQDLSHRIWRRDPRALPFETSFGMLAWERGGDGTTRRVERRGALVAWGRCTPGYARIRRAGVWDEAPPSLTWLVDPDIPDHDAALADILDWAEQASDEPFTTSHAEADAAGADLLRLHGFVPDRTEPFGIYLQQRLDHVEEPCLAGYRFTTMAELHDVEARAAVHRRSWDGSTRSADDVRRTMATWPYRSDLDVIAVADDGALAGSAIVWFDATYDYGEIEPVGVVDEHRGTGVGAAMLRFALARLRDAGATFAVVGARGDDDYPVPRQLYRSVGFEVVARQVIVRR